MQHDYSTGGMCCFAHHFCCCAGLSVLLLTGVLKWKDCLQYPPAWDTLFWFAVLVGMSGTLSIIIPTVFCLPAASWFGSHARTALAASSQAERCIF